jgi:CO/xanthine dehydrogenase FAD-binding subunit
MDMTYQYLKRLPQFKYLAPKNLEEALQYVSRCPEGTRFIAGGTDLLLKMKLREEHPHYLVGLKCILGLDYIHFDEAAGLRLGPLVTIHTLGTSPVIKEKFPVLSQAASVLGSVQVRNLATVAGNLCSALPSADMAPGLIVLGARLKISGVQVERALAVEQFFISPGVSALMPGEMVSEIQVPLPPTGSRMVYLKHTLRSAMDLSIVSVAVMLALEGGICRKVRIALGTAAPVPMRALQAEEALEGNPVDAALIEKAALTASLECSPRSSRRASAEYRREMVKVLCVRALQEVTGTGK